MILELCFPIYGHDPLPADHGFLLYSALCEVVPTIRNSSEIAVHTVTGRRVGDRLLILMPFSELVLRLPDIRIGDCLPLSGQILSIGVRSIKVGIPQVRALRESRHLRSPFVTLAGVSVPEQFESELRHRLRQMGVESKVESILQPRRPLRLGNRWIMGYEVVLTGLSDSESLLIQENRVTSSNRGFDFRHIGCGIFLPVNRVRKFL
jgi:CRISPR-associated protein Cas6